ncbi:MAG: dockerin type I repeat-containing protein [Planctomycetes bacterium]|nr:dockerin type I repeat-containing protein [Planctomycetota bacterium]
MKRSARRWTVLCAAMLACAGSVQGQDLVPGGIETAELDRIVPDTLVHDNAGLSALGNWEPFASVLGNSVFLIEGNTYAEPAAQGMQRYVVMLQPVAGGEPRQGEAFFTDEGAPYAGPINNYRQNGNPGRVAGDKRPGAVNFIAGGETSANEYPDFWEDDRWDTGVIRQGRFATVQTYSLDAESLEQTMQCRALDAINGRLTSGNPGTDEISRFGGDLTALDDGNFVVVVDDKSNLHLGERGATAVIIAPDGSIVKDTFVIGAGQIWSNVAAFKGGFCVRLGGVLKFYDNGGELQGQIDQHSVDLVDPLGNPVTFDTGRGDGTRIASHINSTYVFLAGVSGSDVRVAVYDAEARLYVAQTNVNELTEDLGGTDEEVFRPELNRVNLAVDALNRLVVTYEVNIGTLQTQTAARVLAFDEGEEAFVYLTPTFFPFVNFETTAGVGTPLRTYRPSAAMTTREICIAAKGEINSSNEPADGADTPSEINFYTVISHPDPQDDPTPPVEEEPPPETLYLRGDANADGRQDLSDAVYILSYLYTGGSVLTCMKAGDTNDSSLVDLSDAVYLLNHLYLGGLRPDDPWTECGRDPTPDELTCESHAPCEEE